MTLSRTRNLTEQPRGIFRWPGLCQSPATVNPEKGLLFASKYAMFTRRMDLSGKRQRESVYAVCIENSSEIVRLTHLP